MSNQQELNNENIYNIVLTNGGKSIELNFPKATDEMLHSFGYILPEDSRCKEGIIALNGVVNNLKPILGSSFNGIVRKDTKKKVFITLQGTNILSYERNIIIDPRINNKIATFWEISLDGRIFTELSKPSVAEAIVAELNNESADLYLAETIKNQLLDYYQKK